MTTIGEYLATQKKEGEDVDALKQALKDEGFKEEKNIIAIVAPGAAFAEDLCNTLIKQYKITRGLVSDLVTAAHNAKNQGLFFFFINIFK